MGWNSFRVPYQDQDRKFEFRTGRQTPITPGLARKLKRKWEYSGNFYKILGGHKMEVGIML